MKKYIVLVFTIIFLISLTQVSLARKGVGIVWDTETEIVNEDSVHCVQYGVYNPWDEDVTAVLSVSKELKDVIVMEESESKYIAAETFHNKSVPIEFCFRIAKIYSEDCIMGSTLCEQTCSEEQVEYEGKIIAMEKAGGMTGGSAGSATALGVSVPLKLRVKCVPHPRDYGPIYVVVIIIALILLGMVLAKAKRKK